MPGRTSVVRARWKAEIDAGRVILCALCNEPVPARAGGKNRVKFGGKGAISVDHVIPKSRGGTSRFDNLQPTHAKCNYDKADRLAKASNV